MKTLKGLDEKVANVLTNTGGIEPPSYKEIILNSVGSVRGLEPAKVVKLGKLGLIVLAMKNDQELEDGDFDLLREVIQKAHVYPDFWLGLCDEKFKQADFEATQKENQAKK